MKPKVSIIIPVYNKANYLSQCLDSVINQTLKDIEIICVNDGSTDSCCDILEEYKKKDSRIKIINQDNQGLIRSRKIGMQTSQADYIGFVDSDDIIELNMFERLLELMLLHNVCLVDSIISTINSNGTSHKQETSLKSGIYSRLSEHNNICDHLFEMSPSFCTKLFKKEVALKAYGDTPENMNKFEDQVALRRFIPFLDNIYITTETFYFHRTVEQSMSRKIDDKFMQKANKFYLLTKESFVIHEKAKTLIQSLKKNYINSLLQGIALIHDSDNIIYKSICNYGEFDNLTGKVALYGAGTVGKSNYAEIKSNKNLELIAWLDLNKHGTEICGYKIEKPERILDIEYDLIIVSVLDTEVAVKIIDKLKSDYNVPASKIYHREPKKAYDMLVFENIKKETP